MVQWFMATSTDLILGHIPWDVKDIYNGTPPFVLNHTHWTRKCQSYNKTWNPSIYVQDSGM